MLKLIDKIKLWSGWLLLTWFVVILTLALIPVSSSVTKLDIGKIEIRFDYLYHIIAFATGTLLAFLYSVRNYPYPQPPALPVNRSFSEGWRPVRKNRLIILISLILIYAILHEYLQKLIPYRSFNINDIISNLLGVIMGVIISTLLRRHIR
jgi:uncharacterized membrane protein